METEKSGWKCWVALANRIFVSFPVVYLQSDGTHGIFVLCSVLYSYQVSERYHPVKNFYFFFLKRNVNYVQIKPCPFLAPGPTTSYKGVGTAKGLSTRELLCLPESTWCPWVTNCPAQRHLTLLPGQEGLESTDSRILSRVLTTSLAIFKNLICLTLTFYGK